MWSIQKKCGRIVTVIVSTWLYLYLGVYFTAIFYFCKYVDLFLEKNVYILHGANSLSFVPHTPGNCKPSTPSCQTYWSFVKGSFCNTPHILNYDTVSANVLQIIFHGISVPESYPKCGEESGTRDRLRCHLLSSGFGPKLPACAGQSGW